MGTERFIAVGAFLVELLAYQVSMVCAANWPCPLVTVSSNSICNGNRTEWSPIRSVIIRVITKSDDRAAGVRFVYHEYDYRQNWTTRSLITN